MKITIIAGPNGAGKTTFAKEHLLQEIDRNVFVNADSIATQLNPKQPSSIAFQAGRLLIEAIHGHVADGESFAIETTPSGRGNAR